MSPHKTYVLCGVDCMQLAGSPQLGAIRCNFNITQSGQISENMCAILLCAVSDGMHALGKIMMTSSNGNALLVICAGNSPVNSPHKGQWHGALMFSLICARINGWVNDGEAGDLRRHGSQYDVTVMVHQVAASLALFIPTIRFSSVYTLSEGHRWNISSDTHVYRAIQWSEQHCFILVHFF